ncbi:hypothetical protein EYF80_061671 [Liparis tanakae]|uniref:Uncharacterized protein n=1 Tax=Liparis tanakae TaxID=230148 RepID=A0A4Z2EHM9_9TELE|nr:hypothetical protein EYF80_061671 [Liparis tanakae]
MEVWIVEVWIVDHTYYKLPIHSKKAASLKNMCGRRDKNDVAFVVKKKGKKTLQDGGEEEKLHTVGL